MCRKLKRKNTLVMKKLSSLFFSQNMYSVLTLQKSQSNFTVLPSFLLSDAKWYISFFWACVNWGVNLPPRREWSHPHIFLGMNSNTHCPPSHELTWNLTWKSNIPVCALALQEQGQMMASAQAPAFIVLYLLIQT